MIFWIRKDFRKKEATFRWLKFRSRLLSGFRAFRGKIQAARYSVGVLPVLRLKKRTKCCG